MISPNVAIGLLFGLGVAAGAYFLFRDLVWGPRKPWSPTEYDSQSPSEGLD